MAVLFITLADARDIAIVVYSILGAVLCLIAAIFFVLLIRGVLYVRDTVRELVDDSIKPTLGSIRDTADSIKGTTDFVGEKAVSPIIKTYGMASGARKGLGVLSGLARRRGANGP